MNYYHKYPGDYAGDTQHLTLMEHGAYNKLMDYCYGKDTIEIPKTDDLRNRICGARTRHEKEAVRNVVREFFPDGINPRIERQLPEELKRVAVARANGALGGRPKVEPSGLATGNPAGNPAGNPELTQLESSPTPTPTPLPHPQPPHPLKDDHIQKADMVVVSAETALDDGTRVPEKSNGGGRAVPCPHQDIIDLYHEVLPMCPKVRLWTPERKRMLSTRWREDPGRQSLGWWRGYFEDVAESEFLTGRTKEGFLVCLEWLVKPRNLVKVYEGNYHK